jgi:Cu2+-exporting ATPase
VHLLAGFDEARCLAIAAALERASTHPLARAFAAFGSGAIDASEWCEVAGQGVDARIDGERYRIGRHEFVAALQTGAPVPAPAAAAAAPADVDDCLWLGNGSGLVAGFELVDSLRPGAHEAVAALRAAGLDLVIASGDRHGAVRAIAAELGISHAQGRLDPAAKLAVVRELQQRGRRVLMIGDGINDGPVLAAADVACAMGQGAAIAQSAADLLLMNESLAVIAEAVATARGNAGLVRSNLRWALGYNLAAVPLAALGLVPPWLAAIGMSASSLYVVWRAQRFAKAAR